MRSGVKGLSFLKIARFLPLCASATAFAQEGDRRDFSRMVWEVALHGGFNATQVRLTNDDSKFESNGYNGFAVGGGLVLLPNPLVAFELDGIYSGRVFGFGSTKGFFNSFQVPVMTQLRIGSLRVGGGFYGSFWNKKGKLLEGDSSAEVSTEDFGNAAIEAGFVSQIGLRTLISNSPVRFEFRALSSLTDTAKSKTLKGSVREYQFLVGYDFDKSTRLPFWKSAGGQ